MEVENHLFVKENSIPRGPLHVYTILSWNRADEICEASRSWSQSLEIVRRCMPEMLVGQHRDGCATAILFRPQRRSEVGAPREVSA